MPLDWWRGGCSTEMVNETKNIVRRHVGSVGFDIPAALERHEWYLSVTVECWVTGWN